MNNDMLKGAYVLGSFVEFTAFVIAAAYFHNAWSFLLLFCAVTTAFSFGMRMKEWAPL